MSDNEEYNEFIELFLTDETCETCDGTGKVRREVKQHGTFTEKDVECHACHGYKRKLTEEAHEFLQFLYKQLEVKEAIARNTPTEIG